MSIRDYGMAVLDAYEGRDDYFCALSVAMLDYGSLAQIGKGNASDLANNRLTEAQQYYLNSYSWPNQ